MKKADAIVQSLLLILAFTALFLSIIANSMIACLVFYLQLILILWQIISAMEMISGHEKYPDRQYRKAKIYMTCFFTYLLGFAFLCEKSADILPVTWFYGGWLPVLFYAVFTVRIAFAKAPKRKTFMDILN